MTDVDSLADIVQVSDDGCPTLLLQMLVMDEPLARQKLFFVNFMKLLENKDKHYKTIIEYMKLHI